MCDTTTGSDFDRLSDTRPPTAQAEISTINDLIEGRPWQSVVVEQDVEIGTGDGICDAALYIPQGVGTWPAVLIWTDVLGLRPTFRDMGRRIAARGYVALVPNPFYRWHRAPVVEGAINLNNLDTRAIVFDLAKQITTDAIAKDTRSFLSFLDARHETDTGKKAGVHGYCMGGQLAVRSAAAMPARLGAVGSFHGSMLVTSDAESPHHSIRAAAASYLVAVARNDDIANPGAKDTLTAAFAEAGRPATVKVFAADHGWCVEGTSAYDKTHAEEAWAELCELYERTLI